MKILLAIIVFIFLRMLLRKFFLIEKKSYSASVKSNKNDIIDVDYEELE
tara:strand:- start:3394 stop:3540 length:147 start_codon:yes stop_codon:yes gene_type:complete